MDRESCLVAKYSAGPIAVIAGLAVIIYSLITYDFGASTISDCAMNVINIILCFVQMIYFVLMVIPDKLVVRLFTFGRKTYFYINATLLLCMFLSIANVFIRFWALLNTDAIDEYIMLTYISLQAAFYISLYMSNIRHASKITIYLFGSAYIAFYIYIFLDSPDLIAPDIHTATVLCVIAMIVNSYYFITLKTAFYFQCFDLPVQSDDKNDDGYIEPLYILCVYRFEETNHVIYRNADTNQYYHGLLDSKKFDLKAITNDERDVKIYAEVNENIFANFCQSQTIGL